VYKRNIITGLEGCGKSSRHFQAVKDLASPAFPVLFGFKSYALMQEQIQSWHRAFQVPLSEFCIAGTAREYQKALDSYTNPEQPTFIGKGVRFVFATQSCIQKNGHLTFFSELTKDFVKYHSIVIDEFDFTVGLIPSLDYELQTLRQDKIKEAVIKDKQRWVRKYYTEEDVLKLKAKAYFHDKGFFLANWIESSEYPISFISSEILSARILKRLGFVEQNVLSPDFKDCIVNVWSRDYIDRTFFQKMNLYLGWENLKNDYDFLISDNVNSYFQRYEEQLDIRVYTHTGCKGSNNLIGSQILTVLSHIPQQVIREIRDTFNFFGDNIEFKEVEALFYRDRLCQAIGRVLGHRGSKHTDLIIHQSILEKIKNLNEFPYTLNLDWQFNFEGFNEILHKVRETKKLKETSKSKKNKGVVTIKDWTFLDEIFIKDDQSYITTKHLKKILEDRKDLLANHGIFGQIPSTSIARYFQTKVKNIRIKESNNQPTRCLWGVKPLT
jgi:hypothetical protein